MKYVPIQLSIFLTMGIIGGKYLFVESSIILSVLLSLVVVLGVVFYLVHKQILGKNSFSILGFITIFTIGFGSINFNNYKNNKEHYSNQNLDLSKPYSMQLRVKEVLKPSTFNNKYVVTLNALENKNLKGNLLLQITKDSQKIKLDIDNLIFTKTNFKNISKPLNPFEFDYKTYLEKKNILHQVIINSNEFVKVKSNNSTLQGKASRFRKLVNIALVKNGFKDNELAIINALILGQRQLVSNNVMENYANAGAIHILAVSGLHVGIIMLFLTFLFKPFEMLKNGKIFVLILTVCTLWMYAVIAGLSPSIVRAVTMFSFLSVSIILKRQTNVFNTLSISYLILLLIYPNFLFEVGFQMSYLAVFFIVWLQPKIVKLITVKNWFLNKVWQLFTVSTAAQIGVLPLSLYYFHQFPGLFFVSNIVIIPFLGFILIFGITVIILSLLNMLPVIIADLYNWVIASLNNFIEWVAFQESFIIKNIAFSLYLMIVSYAILFLFFLYVENKKVKYLLASLTFVIVFQGFLFYEKFTIEKTSELVAFNKTKHTILAIRKAKNLVIYSNLDSLHSKTYPLEPYVTNNRIKKIDSNVLPNIIFFENEKVLIVDEKGIYKYNNLKPAVVLLRNSPKINLERLILQLKPSLIIADASNYKSLIKKWRVTSIKQKTPFYATSQNGAYIKKTM